MTRLEPTTLFLPETRCGHQGTPVFCPLQRPQPQLAAFLPVLSGQNPDGGWPVGQPGPSPPPAALPGHHAGFRAVLLTAGHCHLQAEPRSPGQLEHQVETLPKGIFIRSPEALASVLVLGS